MLYKTINKGCFDFLQGAEVVGIFHTLL